MSKLVTISRLYAKAAFDFAVKTKSIDHWQEMLMSVLKATKDQQIKKILSNRLAQKTIAELLIEVCSTNLDQYGQNLIKIMAHYGRLDIFPSVFKEFINLRMASESIVEIEIISTRVLNKKQLSKIRIAMEQRLSKTVLIKYKIDKSLIAGVIIRLDDFVIDGSIRGCLASLSTAIQS